MSACPDYRDHAGRATRVPARRAGRRRRALDPQWRSGCRRAEVVRIDFLDAPVSLKRLAYDGALKAVQKPARQAGCRFDEGVAQKLVDNLRQIKTGSAETEASQGENAPLGPYVEPV